MRTTFIPSRLAAYVLSVGCVAGCAPRDSVARLVSFEDVARATHDITLDETSEVLNVTPRVVTDPRGGYIVADPSESQVRLYSTSGKLLARFGRKGTGPGEFDRLAGAVRTPAGELLAFDMNGRLTIFDPSGSHVLRTQQTPVAPLYDVAVVDDRRVAITGRLAAATHSPLVHLWDYRKGLLAGSFFRPVPPRPDLESAYLFSGFTDVAVRHDTVAVLFALSDTLFFYDTTGRARGKLPLPFADYRALREPMPKLSPPDRLYRWIESFSTASHVYLQADGTILVQFFDTKAREPEWRLLSMRRDGRPLFEIRNSPKLLALASDANSLVFVKPGSSAPNQWTIAQVQQ
jgi:hypothetical protein